MTQPNPYAAPSAPEGRTNTLAIIALVLGIVVPIGGIITGHIALNQIKRTGEAGRGMALAGTIIGYVLTALTIILGILWIVAFAALMQTGTYGTVSEFGSLR